MVHELKVALKLLYCELFTFLFICLILKLPGTLVKPKSMY